MALRYRPYYPRRYNQQVTGGGQQAGEQIGGQLEKLAVAIKAAQEKATQDRVANQLLNANWATPRAQWVGGTKPKAGVNLAGTAPATGGLAELQLRIAEAKARQAIDTQNAKTQIARTAATNRTTTGRNPYGGGNSNVVRQPSGKTPAVKTPKYAAGTYDAENSTISGDTSGKKVADSYAMLQADIDGKYPKGTYNKLQSLLSMATKNKDGTYSVDNSIGSIDPKTGNVLIKDKNGEPVLSIPAADAAAFKSRYNSILVGEGKAPISLDLGTANKSTYPPGSQQNPYIVKNNLDMKQVPRGAYVINPKDGSTVQKPDSVSAAKAPVTQAPTVQQPRNGGPLQGHIPFRPPDTTTSTDTQPTGPDLSNIPIAQTDSNQNLPQLPTSPDAVASATDYTGGDADQVNRAVAANNLRNAPTPSDVGGDASGGSTISMIDPNLRSDATLPNQDVVPTSDQDMLADAISRSNAADDLAVINPDQYT